MGVGVSPCVCALPLCMCTGRINVSRPTNRIMTVIVGRLSPSAKCPRSQRGCHQSSVIHIIRIDMGKMRTVQRRRNGTLNAVQIPFTGKFISEMS